MLYKVFTNTHTTLTGFENTYSVIDYYESDRVGGGPIIAIFYNELMAIEYADFKNKQKQNLIYEDKK